MLNRAQIFAAIDAQIARAAGNDGRFGLLMVHVHGLRDITLRFGYARGEQAGEAAQQLIEQSLRPVDQVYRAGDDSFAVVLPDLRNSHHALLAATRLIAAFEQPLQVAGTPWHGRAIVGVAVYPEHGTAADPLCRSAEMAHDDACQRGDRHALHARTGAPAELFYDELRGAIEANQLQAVLQPIVNLQTGCVSGAESLARWTSERHGEVSPAQFVPLAEQSDLISALTRWSIHATLRHAAALRRGHDLSFAINISPRVFGEPGLVEQLLGALEIWGVPATAVIIEITETALINDIHTSVQVLRRLRDQGMRIAIDDFGTGYASFSYLRQFPATELKIDMSLVFDMLRDPRTAKLVQAMIDMAHHLDLAAVAEGIEDAQTQRMLAEMGCDYGQGYHLGRPTPAHAFANRFLLPP